MTPQHEKMERAAYASCVWGFGVFLCYFWFLLDSMSMTSFWCAAVCFSISMFYFFRYAYLRGQSGG